MEELKIHAAQVASSNMDGGTRVIFGSSEYIKLGDYYTVEYEGERLKFKVSIVSAFQEPELYAVTANFKGRNHIIDTLDVRKLLGLTLTKADEDLQKKFENAEGLC